MDERAEEHEVDSSDSSAHHERNEVIMFVIKTVSNGYMVVDYDVDQQSKFKDARFSFSFNLNCATQFDTMPEVLQAAADYGQRRERLFPGRAVALMELCRVEQSGLHVVETL